MIVRVITIMALALTLLTSAISDYAPVPFADGSFFSNSSGRYIVLQSEPSLGKLKSRSSQVFLAGDLKLGSASSECMWGTYESVLFLGSPPSSCRQGKRIDGLSINGFAQINVSLEDAVEVIVNYPMPKNNQLNTVSIGPFSDCHASVDALGEFNCNSELYTAVEIYGNFSSVWVVNPSYRSQGPLLQFMGLVQAVLFATIAARGKYNVMKSIYNVLALAADAAMGGAFTVAVILAAGRSIVGLEAEVGPQLAQYMELGLAFYCVLLSVIAWSHSITYEMHSFVPKWIGSWRLPFRAALRELCEIPLLISMTVIWPLSAGPHFLIQLQFMASLAISFIAGRGGGLLVSDGMYYSRRLAAVGSACLMLGGIFVSTTLSLGTVAATGALVRGASTFVFSCTLQIHVTAAGFYFGTSVRLNELMKKTKQAVAL